MTANGTNQPVCQGLIDGVCIEAAAIAANIRAVICNIKYLFLYRVKGMLHAGPGPSAGNGELDSLFPQLFDHIKQLRI